MSREATLSRFKEKLQRGEAVAGVQHSSGSEAVCEAIAFAGFDFVIIDMEHSGYTASTMVTVMRAAEACDLVAFVRVMKNDPHEIMQALDAGAQGVLVPHVRGAADVGSAIAAMRFRPAGIRGKTAGSRAARWGSSEWREYEEWANREPMVIPIIEEEEALAHMEEICCVPSVELVCLGPGDLSQSMGYPGAGLRAEPVMDALDRLIDVASANSIGVMTVPLPDLTGPWAASLIRRGVRAIWFGYDVGLIAKHFRRLRQEVDGEAGTAL